MSHRIYREYSEAYDACNIALMAVETCSKAISAWVGRHGKKVYAFQEGFF